MKKKSNKFLAVLLSLMMVAVFVPTFSFAADRDGTITVYLTVSDKGELATANDGSAMAWKDVTVTDIDGDGHFTFDEALAAAHAAYNDPTGYDPGNGFAKKLWGQETTNLLFFVNGVGLSTGITADEVADGDYLLASINKDVKYYADWISKFGTNTETALAGKDFNVSLTGHLGMAYTEEDMKYVPIDGVDVGVWSDGTFTKLAQTNEKGTAAISFDEPGTYIVTAKGEKSGVTATDWNLYSLGEVEGVKPFGYIASDSYVAYTEADYGGGPYPADEIKYIEFMVENEDPETCDDEPWLYPWTELNYLKDNTVITDAAIMAPVCIVKVTGQDSIAEAKEKAINDLNGAVDYSKYKTGQQMQAMSEIIAGMIAINAAGTVTDVEAAYDAAIAAIDGIITAKEYDTQAAKTVAGFKVTKGKKKATVKWTLNKSNFDAYQVYYKPAGKSAKTVSTKNGSIVVKGLKSKKKCTFRVRGYKTIKGVQVFGKWSATKTVKIK